VSLSSPAGELIVVQVAGEVDLFTVPVLRDALADSLARGPCELVVDLAAMTFCDLRGLRLLVETTATAAGSGIGYAVAGVPAHTGKVWLLLWPPAELPMQFPTAAEAVLAAMAHQAKIVAVDDNRARPAPTPDPGRVRSWSASNPVAHPAPISAALPTARSTSTPQQRAG
jgi:anti-sigma B factor antagonist